MTRPLFYQTLAELDAQVERNADHDAELALIEAELRVRASKAAIELLARVKRMRVALKAEPGAEGLADASSLLTTSQARRWAVPAANGAAGAAAKQSASPSRAAPPMTDEQRWTADAVAGLRTKLIDLGKRNPLIAFKHGGRGALHLRIVDERPDLLFAALDKSEMTFEPLPDEDVVPPDETAASFRIAYERAQLTDAAFIAATEALGDDESDARAWQAAERALRVAVRAQLGLPALDYGKAIDVQALARAHGFDPSFDLQPGGEGEVPAHHRDDRIRILQTRKEMDKRLKAIVERQRSHLRETGLHTLFLVLGFVQWYEDEASDVPLHAPLLLMPVQLDSKVVGGRYAYRLSAHDEGLQVNIALAEKMRQHMGLALPELAEDETPESYFARVAAVLTLGRRLTLRRFATLAVLPFPRMVLWKDLDPATWPDGAFSDHPMLPEILGARAVAGEAAMAETLDIDGPEWATRAPALIQPADASQHSALIDVAQGHSLSLEGPPGTGKSQTITNIIANALGAGKRVLFVAEKQAALSVVATRLRAAGFGPLLLELHGDTANRTHVYAGLNARLKATASSDPATLEAARGQLRGQREVLRRYLALIAQPLGSLGRTTYWLAWREINLRGSLDAAAIAHVGERWTRGDVRGIDRANLADRRSRLDSFDAALRAIDAERVGARTAWMDATRLGAFDQSDARAAADAAGRAAAVVAEAGAALETVAPLRMPAQLDAARAAAEQLGALEPFEDVDEAVAGCALNHADAARALLGVQERWRRLASTLAADVSDPSRVSGDAVARLIQAAGADFVPDTVASARDDLAQTLSAVAMDRQLGAERTELTQTLRLRSGTTVAELRVVADVIAGLATATPIVGALQRAELLDPLARIAIDGERAAAAALLDERAVLVPMLSEEAFDTDGAELARLSDVLADSGVVSRLLGTDFRAARRQAGRLVQDISDRAAAAGVLRRLARHKARVAAFRAESVAAAWFPATLWRGVHSDWASQAEATASLARAQGTLIAAKGEGALFAWLALAAHERTRMADIAHRLSDLLGLADMLGLADTPNVEAAALTDTLAQWHDDAALLDTALIGVGALPGGLIVRDGAPLGDRLRALHAARAEFDAARAATGFDWVGDVDRPLDMLVRASARADAVVGLPGPLFVARALAKADAPAAMLTALIARRAHYAAALDDWRTTSARLHEVCGLAHAVIAGAADWSARAAMLRDMAADETGARLAADLLKYGAALAEVGCEAFGIAAVEGTATPGRLADLYELLLIQSLLAEYLGGDGAELGRLGSLTLDAARAAFVRIDIELHGLEARAIVAGRLSESGIKGVGYGPRGTWTEMSLLDNEIALKRPRTSLRDVTHRAGASLQALQPVWMMSPTSAAQYIRPGSLQFDLLVVDEASQMRPEFALSSIMRARQFVVVGDANQLPPTDFFATATDVDTMEADEATVVVDTESILDLANQRFRHKRRLKWHYRSQHETLIQFSNREFYDGDLIVFPSPTVGDDLLGVKNFYVGGTYEASINQREAEAVIEEAFRLMRTYPQASIGIATMNAKQTELIRNEFDRLILEAPEVRAYVDEYAGGIDEFFIKNLENVQGDERDVILISTVYGPDKNGTVRQNFGPLNREVGWRRLNVLVTRAKLSTRVFTSLRPNDVKVVETSSRGLRAFQAYLAYAVGAARYDDSGGGEPDSDFEVFVADALRAAGYEVVHQVGVDGFRIDLGVRHADYPAGFVAGIECDGARFHSGMTVRDRDRIRQTILESMGWKIYRIWSTDWFGDPRREMARLLAKLDQWRAGFAADHARKAPIEAEETAVPAAEPGATEVPHAVDAPHAADEHVQPVGRAQRPLDDIAWYEVSQGLLYEVWLDDRLAGEVEILSRATAAPRVYGGTVTTQRSEYEGRVVASGERFKMHDIHATVREVARRARAG